MAKAVKQPAGAKVAGRVLSVASEAVPLIKTGGLADVVGALPHALHTRGWQARTLIPAYRGLPDELTDLADIWSDPDLFGGPAQVLKGDAGGHQMLLLDAPHLFDRAGGPYSANGQDHADNPERFAALSWVASELAQGRGSDGWVPDILHAHDWQAGFAPYYLSRSGSLVPSVMTVHNMAFQGVTGANRLQGLRLLPEDFSADVLEYYGNISSLKAGIVTAHAMTTVSPTYAEELMRPEFGMGLQGVVAARAAQGAVTGILNGIDDEIWNPETDPEVQAAFSATHLQGKRACRSAILSEFGLADVPGPVLIIVSRLTYQKGIDLVPGVIGPFLEAGGALLVLGSGDAALEQAMHDAAGRWPGRVAVRIGYDEGLSHRMFAGADAVLVPSRFEPCGLTQMYGLRYGTVPLVAATGGLVDSVIGATTASLATDAATGITFGPVDALALGQALRKLTDLYADRPLWTAIQKRGMKADMGWHRAAGRYVDLYERLLGR